MGRHRDAGEDRQALSGPAARPVLAKGSVGSEVRDLQERLRLLGFYRGRVDGAFGSLTREALVAFQESRGLEPDGLAGRRVWKALRL